MMLNKGELNGVRILREETVDLMISDHRDLIPVSPFGKTMGMEGAGFGLGFRIKTAPAGTDGPDSAGTFSWGGAASTIFWIDPGQDMIGIFMIQISPAKFDVPYRFKRLVYEAIDGQDQV